MSHPTMLDDVGPTCWIHLIRPLCDMTAIIVAFNLLALVNHVLGSSIASQVILENMSQHTLLVDSERSAAVFFS